MSDFIYKYVAAVAMVCGFIVVCVASLLQLMRDFARDLVGERHGS